jgi:uncharacterized protein (TIGR02145 family)
MLIMKNHFHLIKLLLLLFSFATFAQVKMGDNPSTIGASSALELESATKALLITRVANTAAITSPVNGMLIYDISASCIKGYQNGAWTNCVGSTNNSNGTGIVSAYSCSTASAGSLIAGTAASGATQTITATVITVGTYNISATANGVTFAASGTFTGTGAQNIVLTATGTPTALGSNTFTLNTNPNCSFSRTTQSLSSNGTGVVSAYSCSTASAGTLTIGVAVSGVTQTITAIVTTIGSYSISSTTNGVTFAASGTFTGLGAQNIVLTATGTPTATGSNTFTLNTSPNCNFSRTVIAPANPTGAGALAGTTCFDVAVSNDNANGCGALSGRTAQKANFTLSATNTQTYTFTPSGTVSNVRFVYVNTNGTAITAITGGNSGNNISTAQTATVTYANTLNTSATGLTNSNALTSDIYVIYNNGATNNGTDVQIKITASIKDCACCGAFVAAGVYKAFLCHNLGADTTLDPNVPVVGLQGAYIQWGQRGPNTTGDARVDWQTAANTSNFAAAPTATNANASAIAGWSTTVATDYSWRTAGGAKTANDPCPAGYRVPTQSEWAVVNTYNTASRTGTFTSSSTNYGAALHYGPNASTKLLTLPAAGDRDSNSNLVNRGSWGFYWSSTASSFNANYGFNLNFVSNSENSSGSDSRLYGFSLR